MSAALDARGLKRVCVSCGIRFYDFNKRPINCPNCETEFSGEIKLKGRRGRAAAVAEADPVAAKAATPAANDEQGTEVEAREDGIVSLEDVAAIEDSGDDSDDDSTLEVDDEDEIGIEELEEEGELDVEVDQKKE